MANELAWLLATCRDVEHRNAEQAIKLAERACELSDWSEHKYLGTLAVAYAEAGDYESAGGVAKQGARSGS